MTKERRLGRGLEALLGRAGEGDASAGAGLLKLNVYEIERNPCQPRRDFDEEDITSLAESLREHGLLQPLVVRRVEGRYQLVAGERRLRAAIKAGWEEVPAQLREFDDRQVAEVAIVENLQRKDLSPLEKAASFRDYLERYGATQEELAGRLKIDRSTIANLIRLLELPDEVQQALRRGAITQGHARALLPLGDEREQIAFCQRIEAEGLNVRATESLVQQTIQEADAEPLSIVSRDGRSTRTSRPRSEHLGSLEQEFRVALGTKVDVHHNRSGRGRIVIHFTNHAEFERLQALLCRAERQRAQAG